MDDPALVRSVECLRDLLSDLNRVGGGKRPSRDTIGKRLAFDELHHDRVDRFGDAVDPGDIAMVQGGEDRRFTLEASAAIRIL
jgi:hypothetical protein